MTTHLIEIRDFEARRTRAVECEIADEVIGVEELMAAAHAALEAQGFSNYKVKRIFALRFERADGQ